MSRSGTVAAEKPTRQRILKAAEDVFAPHGFNGSTIEAIAAKTKVSRALLYYYFESKDHICGTLIEQGVRVFKEMSGRAEKAGPEPRPRLREFVRECIELCCADRALARMGRREPRTWNWLPAH